MFTKKSFEVFEIAGLTPRMAAIRSIIQPEFAQLGNKLLTELSVNFPSENFYLHIAKHLRRTTNAPENTWCALSTKPRGYKMEVHFQLGIWQDYVFLYLSIIDQPKNQQRYAELLAEPSLRNIVPKDFVLSKDHTKAEFFPLTDWSAAVERLGKVKKAEFELGRVWPAERFENQSSEVIFSEMMTTLKQLMPIYQQLMEV